jgi:hypothetical protein
MADITVTVGDTALAGSWTEENPETRTAIAEALPVAGDATRWEDELYFSIPVDLPLETGTEVVPVGAVAYWPQGNALCLFWGPTPASDDERPRAASPVAVVATLDEPGNLDSLDGGAHVAVRED